MHITAELLKSSLDTPSTDELLRQIVHGREDAVCSWWKSNLYYPSYFALARLLRPNAIFEVGIRLGYSLISMYRGNPGVSVLAGIDDESYVVDSVAKARENILKSGFTGRLDLRKGSSRCFSKLRAPYFDLIHIDGDHTESGALEDILEYWTLMLPGGVMVVDDASWPDVGRAIVRAKNTLTDLDNDFHYDHDTGWHVFQKARWRGAK